MTQEGNMEEIRKRAGINEDGKYCELNQAYQQIQSSDFYWC